MTLPLITPFNIAHERITYTATCPACGTACEWTDTRRDCRVETTSTCRCGSAA